MAKASRKRKHAQDQAGLLANSLLARVPGAIEGFGVIASAARFAASAGFDRSVFVEAVSRLAAAAWEVGTWMPSAVVGSPRRKDEPAPDTPQPEPQYRCPECGETLGYESERGFRHWMCSCGWDCDLPAGEPPVEPAAEPCASCGSMCPGGDCAEPEPMGEHEMDGFMAALDERRLAAPTPDDDGNPLFDGDVHVKGGA